jgi:hypothetical protein
MNLEELSKSFRVPFDSLLGQDILKQFRSVRIDYKRHVIELSNSSPGDSESGTFDSSEEESCGGCS